MWNRLTTWVNFTTGKTGIFVGSRLLILWWLIKRGILTFGHITIKRNIDIKLKTLWSRWLYTYNKLFHRPLMAIVLFRLLISLFGLT